MLFTELPEATKESLLDPATPQWKAWQWLGAHRNITELQEWRKTQLFALATLYYAFDGPNWGNGLDKDWLDDQRHECYWFSSDWTSLHDDTYQGFQGSKSCNQTTGEFRVLELTGVLKNSKNLAQSIPPEIQLLPSLAVLQLSKNDLNVSLSQFVVPAIPYLQNLKHLRLSFNMLKGPIPTELGKLTKMEALTMYGNHLSGPMPSELALMTDISFLNTFGNSLTSIPTEIGLMTSLTTLWVSDNSFKGQIPSTIGLLTSLTKLVLAENSFTGPVPNAIGQLTGLDELFLERNFLSGSIPTQLFLLQKLSLLWLYENILSGSIPVTKGHKSLSNLRVHDNALSGQLPSEIGLMTSLEDIQLQHNFLSGFLPSELGNLESLYWLYLNDNAFEGLMPSELGKMEYLTVLKMQNNSLSGRIPGYWVSVLANVSDLGPLPVFSFASPTLPPMPNYLHDVDLRGNPLLSGTIPDDLCSLNSVCAVHKVDFSNLQIREEACSLEFDCTGLLCGCNCTCTSQSVVIAGDTP